MSITSIPGLSGIPGITDSKAVAKAPADPAKEKLNKACHEMEGYFVGMLLKKMHESAMKGGLFEEKSEAATYRDMFDDAVSSQIGKKGSFGIADMLYKELSKRQDMADAEAAADHGGVIATIQIDGRQLARTGPTTDGVGQQRVASGEAPPAAAKK